MAEEARVQTAQSLSAREQALFEDGPVALVCLEAAPPFILRSASRAFARFGIDPDAAAGKPMPAIAHAADEETLENACRQAVETNARTGLDHRILGTDGRVRWVHTQLVPAPPHIDAIMYDITDRKRAEHDLSENRMLFKVISDAAQSAIIVRKQTGEVSYVSPAFETIFGVPIERIVESPDSFFDLVVEDDRERITAHAMSIIAHPEHRTGTTFRIKTPGGEEKLISQTCVPIFDEDGEFIGIRSSNRDITKETATRQALAESEERLALAIRATNDGIWDWNVITGEVHFSPRWAALLGLEPEAVEATQEFFYQHIHQDDAHRVEAAMLAHLSGETDAYRIEYRMRKKTGEIIWVRDRGMVVGFREDGLPERMVGTISDITERKKAENEARHASQKATAEKQKLDAVIAAIGDGLAIRDREQRLVFQNRQYRSLLEAKTGQHCSDVYRCNRDGCHTCTIRAATEQAAVHTAMKTVVIGGRKRSFEVTASGLKDADGTIIGAVELVRDITDRMTAERVLVEKKRELEELNRTLEARVVEEIGRRREQEQILIQQSKMAAMGEMMGAIAHQWRQPLNAIGLLVQDIEDAYRYDELSPEYITEFVASAMNQISFMSNTIDDFRNFFRPAKEMTVFDVKIAVDEVLGLLTSQIKAAGITARVLFDCEALCGAEPGGPRVPLHECRSGLLKVKGYYNEFKQVVMNIINNAREAIIDTHAGNDDEDSRRIDICLGLSEDNTDIIMSVSDTGGGIPENILDRVFDPYFTTKEEGRGTGIGLYMSKAIVEQNMHGTITATNAGDGACFTITLARIF